MMLAYQLVSNGIKAHVLERHSDFDREFRGEFAQPSLLEALNQLGLLAALSRDDRVVPIRAVRMHHRGRAFAQNLGVGGQAAGHAVHQPSLLKLLHTQCARFPGYQLSSSAPVTSFVQEDGRVRGVIVRRDGVEERIAARLVIVCNGRGSSLRKEVTAEVDQLEHPYSLLWLRFDLARRPDLCTDTLDGFITPRSYYVLYPTYGKQLQLMWRRPPQHPLDWKSPSEVLKQELLADAPAHWRPIFEEAMTDATERQMLRVMCDRLRRWWAPGVLFLGDAAHTMSPIGGQGLTIAIRDAIVAANHIVRAEQEGTAVGDAVCEAIEAERRPEVEKMQAFQVRAGKIQNSPPLVQWMLAKAVIPLMTRLQSASYLHEVQNGVTKVKVQFPVPLA
jgi:2-polyprenyl-6-methoxyphenol hydroxylase-like FAD-dependent oxidoreductase